MKHVAIMPALNLLRLMPVLVAFVIFLMMGIPVYFSYMTLSDHYFDYDYSYTRRVRNSKKLEIS